MGCGQDGHFFWFFMGKLWTIGKMMTIRISGLGDGHEMAMFEWCLLKWETSASEKWVEKPTKLLSQNVKNNYSIYYK